MAKTVDIAERALEKEKKSFITFCKAAEVFLSIMCALMIVAPIAIVIMIIMQFAMQNGEYTTPEGLFNGIYSVVTCVGMAIAFNFGVKIFSTLKDGETPFRYEIADKIKAAGMAFFATGIVHVIGEALNGFLNATGVFAGELSINLGFNFFIWGAFLTAIAYIFNYGCKLQQESDETL